MSTKELAAIAPFHLQADDVGDYLQSERDREWQAKVACPCGRAGCPDCNTD
jgi:hypothetical protein